MLFGFEQFVLKMLEFDQSIRVQFSEDFTEIRELSPALEILKIKYSWLYPYITPELYREYHKFYLETKAKGYDLDWTMT